MLDIVSSSSDLSLP